MANVAKELFESIAALTAETKSLRKIVTKLEAKLGGDSLEFLTKDTQSETEEAPKEPLTGPLAKLAKALKAHYADYEGSKLAKVAREIYGKAKAKSVALAWAHSAKEPSVTKWAKGRNNAQIQAWFKRQVA